jgi:hypothetical protein
LKRELSIRNGKKRMLGSTSEFEKWQDKRRRRALKQVEANRRALGEVNEGKEK